MDGNRVHTPIFTSKGENPKYRCSICRTERGESSSDLKLPKKAKKELTTAQ